MEPQKQKTKITKLEKRQLIDTLLSYKAKGYRYTDLVKIGMKLRGVTERQAKTYVQWATEEEVAMASKSTEETYGRLFNRLDVLGALAAREGNLEMVNKFTWTEIKLRDSLKKQTKRGRANHEADSVFNPEAFSEEELVKIMAEFEDEGTA
jgi:hypothetical protein